MLTIYHYPNCSTCRRALKWLEQEGIEHKRIDIVQSPPARSLLKQVLAQGAPLKSLFNTSGQSYRDGNFKERLPTLSEDQALAVLAADGKLIKRPLAIGDGVALVGFDEQGWRRALER